MELDKTLKTGKLCLEGRKEPGGGRRLEGQDEPGDERWGTERRSRQNVGSLVEGVPGTLRGAKEVAVWNQTVLELCGIVVGECSGRAG